MSISDSGWPAGGRGSAAAGRDGIEGHRLRRAAPLVGLATRTAGEAVLAGLRGKLTGADSTAVHERAAERYAELLGRSKGALMKAGQMLSFSPEVPAVPAEFRTIYQTALTRLRDDAPPMPPEVAREVLERELSRTVESVFGEFDWEPLAAASIGQVHAARLHDGREVAVKVQYPGVAAAIAADLKNTELLATLLTLIGGLSPRRMSIDLRGVSRELGVHIAAELDYRREAANQREFAERYRGHPFIRVPDVVDELSSARVLTQELVQGRSFSEALTAEQDLRDRWAEAIFRFVYGSNARFCAMNADPHPGNYLFHDDGSVSFLDFGCVKRFRREQVEMLHAIARECVRGDVIGTWRASVEAGFWRSSDPVTPDEVFAYWREPWEMWWGRQPFTVTPEYVAGWIERHLSPNGPSANALRQSTAPPDYAFMARIDAGCSCVIAQLRACGYWGSIVAEYYDGAAPLTAMGKRDQAFFSRQRAEGRSIGDGVALH